MADEWKKSPGNDDNHYEGTIQPIQFIEGKGMSFVEGNVVKYVSRHKKKAGKLDVQKTLWYIDRILDKADEKDLTEDYSVQDYVKSQNFSPLEAQIIFKFMDYWASRNTSDLYVVRDLVKQLEKEEYGDS